MNNFNIEQYLISVIIPTYNNEKTIKYAVKSVLNQTFNNFELIVINDGSQDSTLDSISEIQDSRLQIFSFENAGGNVSRNRGLQRAQGEFVSFLDGDDIWKPEKLELQLAALQNNAWADVAYSWTDYIDEEGNFLVSGSHITANGDIYEKLLVHNFIENGSNPLIRKQILWELGGFDESLKAAQDWDMWLRLSAKCLFVAVPAVHILYRVSANSLSTNLTRQEKFCLQVIESAYQIRPGTDINLLNVSKKNIYKYLTCKALQKPVNQQKGILAANFFYKYLIYENHRLSHSSFIIKLLLKIFIIIIFPSSLSMSLLNKLKTEKQKKAFL